MTARTRTSDFLAKPFRVQPARRLDINVYFVHLVYQGDKMPEKVFVRSIPDELWRAFKARASLEGMTISQALQEAIRDYLAGGSRAGASSVDPFHGLIGLAESGRSDVSENTDAYLASSVADSGKE